MAKSTRIADISGAPSADKTFPATLSTESPVVRANGSYEILSHDPAAVDLSRFPLPVLISHEMNQLPVGVAENPILGNGKLQATIRFSDSEQGQSVARDVAAKIITGLSVGYQILDSVESTDESGNRVTTVTRWQPIELSAVSVPADANAGFFRGYQAQSAADRAEIDWIFSLPSIKGRQDIQAMKDVAVLRQWSPTDCRNMILSLLENEPATDHRYISDDSLGVPNMTHAIQPRIEYGTRAVNISTAELQSGMVDAILTRTGFNVKKPSRIAADFEKTSLREMGEKLKTRNSSGSFLTNGRRAFGHATSDFAALLADVANKGVQLAIEELASNWKVWTRQIDVPDFRALSLIQVGGFSDLAVVPESGEYTQGTIADWKESVSVLTYGKNFGLTRQALINDDLGQFALMTRQFAAAANRKISELAFGVLTANAAMKSDNVALFHANHANLAGSGGAISTTTLDAGIVAMRSQKAASRSSNESGAALNIRPRFLIVPVGKETAAKTVVASSYYPTTVSGVNAYAANPLMNAVEIISDPALDSASATAWYLVADPQKNDGVVVAGLNGDYGISVEEFQPDHNSDNYWWKVRLDCGAAAADYRSLYKNAGA